MENADTSSTSLPPTVSESITTTSTSSESISKRPILDAAEIFLLMRHDFRVSRNVRAQWYFDQLEQPVIVESNVSSHSVSATEKCVAPSISSTVDASCPLRSRDLQVVGVTAKDDAFIRNVIDRPPLQYRVRPDTRVTFLSNCYRFVFVLDFSPSSIVVDKSTGRISYSQIFECLKHCLSNVIKSFRIPGSGGYLFTPRMFVTVLAYSPLLVCPAEQVLIQGCPLSQSNVQNLFAHIQTALSQFVRVVASFSRPLLRRTDAARRKLRDERQSQLLTGNLFVDEQDSYTDNHQADGSTSAQEFEHVNHHRRQPSFCSFVSEPARRRLTERTLFGDASGSSDARTDLMRCVQNVGCVTPDCSLLNMLRLGLLGVQLLPENTQANIVVLTDGVVGVPDADALQALLVQLRSYTVACSFIQVHSGLMKSPGWAHTTYPDLLYFMSSATFGSYLPNCACTMPQADCAEDGAVNMYHRALLCWNFFQALNDHKHLTNAFTPWIGASLRTGVIRRRHLSLLYNTHVDHLVYVRLREGYTLKRVVIGKVIKSSSSHEQQPATNAQSAPSKSTSGKIGRVVLSLLLCSSCDRFNCKCQ